MKAWRGGFLVVVVVLFLAAPVVAEDGELAAVTTTATAQSVLSKVGGPTLPKSRVVHDELRSQLALGNESGLGARADLRWTFQFPGGLSVAPTVRVVELPDLTVPTFEIAQYWVPISWQVPGLENLSFTFDPFKPRKRPIGSVVWASGAFQVRLDAQSTRDTNAEVRLGLWYSF